MNDQILRVMESWGNCSAVYIALEVDKWHKIGNKYQVELKRIKWSDTIKWAVDRELKEHDYDYITNHKTQMGILC